MAEREAGFYWVTVRRCNIVEVAEYRASGVWSLAGSEIDFGESEVKVLSNRLSLDKPQDNTPPSSPAGCLTVWIIVRKTALPEHVKYYVVDNGCQKYYTEDEANRCLFCCNSEEFEVRKVEIRAW